MRSLRVLLVLLAFCFALAVAQGNWAQRGIMVREAQIYLTPDLSSQKLDRIPRGREVVVMDTSALDNRKWLKVLANVDRGRDVTGWMLDKGIVRQSTPNGDRIVYGEAVDAESEASRRGGRRGADREAMRLYYRVYEYFPNSPLAAEALYRAADIRWQLERAEMSARPSAKAADPELRPRVEEEWVREVRRKFPDTKWAQLAAYLALDNRMCGDWQSQPKCPQREAEQYEDYVKEHPTSPKAAEALYEAAWRHAVLVDMYRARSDLDRVNQARSRAIALAQRIAARHAQTDWAHRALRLAFLLEHNVSIYGNAID